MESGCVMFVCASVPPNEDAIPVSTRKRSLAVQLRSVGCATRDSWQSTWPCVLVYGSHATQSQQQCDCSLAAPAQSQAGRRRARSAKAPAPAAAGFLECRLRAGRCNRCSAGSQSCYDQGLGTATLCCCPCLSRLAPRTLLAGGTAALLRPTGRRHRLCGSYES